MASSPGSSTNAPMPDFAFNSSLIGYDVGIPGRQLEQVIRISTAHAMNSKQAGETFAALERDETDAGKEWSHAELAIAGCEKAELAVVVGVLLPQAAIAALPNEALTPAACEHFDQRTHDWVPTNKKTWIVVRKLSDQRGNLFALANKNPGTGLCVILQLPASTTYRHRFFFFREWTGLSKATGQHRLRFNAWKANINQLADQYGGEHGDDLADEVAPPEPVELIPVDHPRDNEAVLRNLLQGIGPFDLEAAEEAAEACEELWFSSLEDAARYQVDPEHLLLLANGLREGVLDGELMIEPRLYRAIVVGFCGRVELHASYVQEPLSEEDIVQVINEAYHEAIRLLGK